MALNLANAMRIETGERMVVYALLLQSIFIGIFAGALDVGANALFLQTNDAELIPKAFMISGVVGIVFTSTYSFFHARMRFSTFAILNLLVVLLFTAGLRASYYAGLDLNLEFIVFVMMGPLIIISLLGFWSTTSRLFTLRQGKRLFGIIDTGQVVGMIAAFYAVPILVNFNFRVVDTLYIALGSLLIVTVLQIYFAKRFQFAAPEKKAKGKQAPRRRSGFFSIFSSGYTSLMASFVALSVVAAFFIHFSFLSVTRERYPADKDLVAFLGTFFGTMMIFTVILKSVFYGWLMKNYGLRLALLISPVILMILTVSAGIAGSLIDSGNESGLVLLFFLLISLSKMFNKSLKDSIEVPSMKVLYQSLDPGIRYNVQARIDGTVNEITAFLAGMIMAGLLAAGFSEIINFSYLLVAFLLVWMIIGARLYARYKHSLKVTLTRAEELKPVADKAYLPVPVYKTGMPMLADMLSINPYFLHFLKDEEISMFQQHTDPSVRQIIASYSGMSLKFLSNASIKKLQRDRMQKDIRGFINYLSKTELKERHDLEKAMASADKEQVFSALLTTVRDGDMEQVPKLITLLRDPDLRIRHAAIEAIEILKSVEPAGYLTDYLDHPDLYEAAWSALVNIGDGIVDNLEIHFHKSGTNDRTRLRIVRAMACIGGEKSCRYLFEKISYHHRLISFEALKGLYINNYKIDETEKSRVIEMINAAIETGAWNLSAGHSINEYGEHSGLRVAIRDEIRRADEILFMLLAITYNKNSVKHIWHSLENVDAHDISYAVELLNLIADEELRGNLEAYFEDTPIREKIRRLQNEFPVDIMPYETLLDQIIARDGMLLGDFIRVCAIDAINRIERKAVEEDYLMPAQAFHPHPVVRQSAAIVLKNRDRKQYDSLVERVGRDLLEFVDEFGDRLSGNDAGVVHPGQHILMDLQQWTLFEGVDINEIFRLVIILKPFRPERVKDKNYVTFMKSGDTRHGSIPADGMIFIPDFHEDLGEIAVRIADGHGASLYQAELKALKELLFDNTSILECIINQLEKLKSLSPEEKHTDEKNGT